MPSKTPANNTPQAKSARETGLGVYKPKPVPPIRVDVYWLNQNQDSNTLALASMTIGGAFKINGIKVMDGQKAPLFPCHRTRRRRVQRHLPRRYARSPPSHERNRHGIV